MADTLRYLTIATDRVWDELVEMFAARGVDIVPMAADCQDPTLDGTFYFLTPKEAITSG